jgi:hypothetical protein
MCVGPVRDVLAFVNQPVSSTILMCCFVELLRRLAARMWVLRFLLRWVRVLPPEPNRDSRCTLPSVFNTGVGAAGVFLCHFYGACPICAGDYRRLGGAMHLT